LVIARFAALCVRVADDAIELPGCKKGAINGCDFDGLQKVDGLKNCAWMILFLAALRWSLLIIDLPHGVATKFFE
jgi:hypothetical protein